MSCDISVPGKTLLTPPKMRTVRERVDLSDIAAARKSLQYYRHMRISGKEFANPIAGQLIKASVITDKRALAKAKARNQPRYRVDAAKQILVMEITSKQGYGSIITRGAMKMTSETIEAAGLLDDSAELFNASLTKFNATSDAAISAAKQRVSQLNDYTNRLATSLTNLNKTLGSVEMARAVESADKIAAALTLLDALEKSGRLEAIMKAIGSGK